jgi:hypothetical protein
MAALQKARRSELRGWASPFELICRVAAAAAVRLQPTL